MQEEEQQQKCLLNSNKKYNRTWIPKGNLTYLTTSMAELSELEIRKHKEWSWFWGASGRQFKALGSSYVTSFQSEPP